MKNQNGLTLVELMVTLAVIIILLAVGMPMFTGVVGSNRATAEANALVSALQLARSEAVKRNLNVYVCTGSTAGNLINSCPINTTNWGAGFFVFADLDGDGALDTPGEIVRQWPNDAGVTTLTANANGRVQFNSAGEEAAGAAWTFEFENADAGGETKRCVRVSITGQVRSERGACA
ncbi:MAG: GspH/FimT family pseudopilin [Gammaproteobacteria bacterium]|nr:GspH/FimT family pseudopilin [Gammaproteobacteria bacterium]